MRDEITNPFLNFNGRTVEVLEWISNFIPHLTGRVSYDCFMKSSRDIRKNKTLTNVDLLPNSGASSIAMITSD